MEKEIVPEDLMQKYAGKVPYDVYFPTVQQKIDSRVCKVCAKYFSTIVMLNEHKRICKRQAVEKGASKKRSRKDQNPKEVTGEELENDPELEVVSIGEADSTIEDEIEFVEEEELVQLRPIISIPGEGGVEVIINLREWLKSPWELASDD